MAIRLETFFPGVEFYLPQPVTPVETTPPHSPIRMEPGEVYAVIPRAQDFLEDAYGEEIAVRAPNTNWTRAEIFSDYRQTLELIRHRTGAYLSRRGRSISFVPRESLIPKNPVERQRLVDKYGPYILDSFAGETRRLPSGGFTIRLGFAGEESVTTDEDVQEMTAHEYGHTLGFHIAETLAEEMKACAFAALYMKTLLDLDQYEFNAGDPDNLHDVARSNVEQLQARGVTEEAILAHLTNQFFGSHDPFEYKRHFRNPVSRFFSFA